MIHSQRYRATTPGGIGNLGPGLDVLGCAVVGGRDEVIAEWYDAPGVTLLDPGHPELPSAAARHASSIAAAAVLAHARRRHATLAAAGVALTVTKGLPLSGGQGGSAASAVAGASAVNALLGDVLDTPALLACCLDAETKVSGRHLDNIAPALLGGIVLVRSLDPIEVLRLPTPTGLHLAIAHPALRLSTAKARRALPDAVSREVLTHQIAHVAAMVAACYADDLALFGRALDDRVAEPARVPLLPGFAAAKRAALEAGALGASISGAGPSAFAVTGDAETGAKVAEAMKRCYEREGIECSARVTTVDHQGTLVTAL
ncbi:MAG TPA: homoserine kinase [Gemmatimonadaceae bacterium]|nr:homoserine kinase [Gemmatimonadaceae bacterium]